MTFCILIGVKILLFKGIFRNVILSIISNQTENSNSGP